MHPPWRLGAMKSLNKTSWLLVPNKILIVIIITYFLIGFWISASSGLHGGRAPGEGLMHFWNLRNDNPVYYKTGIGKSFRNDKSAWQIYYLSLVRSLRSSLVMRSRFSYPLRITPESLRSSGRDLKGICRPAYHSERIFQSHSFI